MEIKRYVSGLLSSNMYVISEGDHAIVIDPFEDTTPSGGLIIDYIILTHEHYDHISGVNMWKKIRDAPVLCSRPCAENIQDPKKNLAYYFEEFCELQTWIKVDVIPKHNKAYSCRADIAFDDETVLKWERHCLHLFEMPGHSMGSIGIVLDDMYFFSGDSLLENTDISLKLPGGSRKKWKEVGFPRLQRISKGSYVYPGHFEKFIYR